MVINWEQFTPLSSLAGGTVIGLAVAALILLNGRIAGISGIVGGLFKMQKGDMEWRIAFVAGLIAAAMAIAGLAVGIGTRYGSGCTSGHGVCGLSRLSPRSIMATLVFMGTGFVMVYVIRHVFNFQI